MTLRPDSTPIEILLVEDNPGDVELTQRVLQDSEFALNISVAEDGEVAMAFLHRRGEYETSTRPDLVLLDLAMPKKTGYEVLEEMNADSVLKSIPVMILTSTQAERDRIRYENVGPHRFCTKPLPLERFNAIIRQLYPIGAAPPQAQPQPVPRMTLEANPKPVEILLVEDNLADVELTWRTLEISQFPLNINVAADGEVAMAYLRQEGNHADAPRPDLIILDLAMPKKSGYEVLEEINGDPYLRGIHIMILTTTQAEQSRLFSYGISPSGNLWGVYQKPLDVSRFNALMGNLMPVLARRTATSPIREASVPSEQATPTRRRWWPFAKR